MSDVVKPGPVGGLTVIAIVEVKFRAFGVTLGTFHKKQSVVVPLDSLPRTPVQINERGVKVDVILEPAFLSRNEQ